VYYRINRESLRYVYMNLSEFAFRIIFIFIFIPGLIALNIANKLTFHKEFKTSGVDVSSLGKF
jgi:hypothetical protein